MTEHDFMEMLNKAVGCLDRNDIDGFRYILQCANESGAADESIRGEMLLLAVIGEKVMPENILETLLRAEKMIGGSSRVLTPQSRFAENHFDAFMLWGRNPGIADEISGKSADIEQITEAYQRLTGFGVGINECFHAQLAFARGDFEEALKWLIATLH